MKLKSQSGSVLVVAAGFALLIAASAAAYIYLSLGIYKRASRAYYYNSAANIAEAGLERGMWALNNNDWTTGVAWTTSGSNKILTGSIAAPNFKDANQMKGYHNILVENYGTTTPTITAEGVFAVPDGAPVRKQIRLYTVTAPYYFSPVAALNDLTLKGGVYDSFRIADGPTTPTHRYNTTVASVSISLGDALLNSNATIYGTVQTGVTSSGSSSFVDAIKGSVLASGTATGGTGVVKVGSNLIDTNQIAYDFEQSYPDPAYPTDTTSTVTLSDPVTLDGAGNLVLGVVGATTPTMYVVNGNLSTSSIVVIGPAYLKVTGTLTLTGNDAVTVQKTSTTVSYGNGPSAGSVTYVGSSYSRIGMYVGGDVSITGNGSVSNTTDIITTTADPTVKVPTISLYGMNTTAGVQNINLGGNGNFLGAIYAPNANITFNGGGSQGYLAGTVVGYNITVTGSKYNIRFPEEYATLSAGTTFKVAKWVELTDPATWHTF
jgi:hypothetical protein